MLTKEGAHDKDVNVIHWNRTEPFIASGGDDCALKVWDLRSFNNGESVAEFKHHHKSPVCSVQWSPHESTMLASAGEDDQIAIWDLAMEPDPEQAAAEDDVVCIQVCRIIFESWEPAFIVCLFFVIECSSSAHVYSPRPTRYQRTALASSNSWHYNFNIGYWF